ncbi:hypothetical protein B0H14DRAFT_3521855 [Mycena olivaceomarginata]|nr:hypothetical protein B0H14DRAFT_3521855 [Mycena olivaceomarginata]
MPVPPVPASKTRPVRFPYPARAAHSTCARATSPRWPMRAHPRPLLTFSTHARPSSIRSGPLPPSATVYAEEERVGP